MLATLLNQTRCQISGYARSGKSPPINEPRMTGYSVYKYETRGRSRVRFPMVSLEFFSDNPRNCLLKQVMEGKIKGEMEVARRRGRRRKKLLDDLKDRRGYSHLKEEALDRTMRRHRFGGGFGPVVRQITG